MKQNHHITKFTKNKPSFYKLTNRQIKQLINYLMFEINQEELNNAIGYTYNCPFCNSKDIYKTEHHSHLYKFKCEACKKKFTNLSKSVISDLLLSESRNRGKRHTYKQSLTDIEVWLCFDIKHDRNYNNIARKNNIADFSNWRYNLLHIPKDLKKDSLINIHERSEESFNRLLDVNKPKAAKNKRIANSRKRFFILTFQEGEFIPKQSLDDLKFMKTNNNSFEIYLNNVKKKKIQQDYQYLRDTLIESYNVECETLNEPSIEDKIYKNIKIPYKHTYSLAFEMAIRNKEVKKILYALKYLKNIKENLLLITNKYYKDQDKSFNVACKANETHNENIKIYKKDLLSQYPYYLNNELHEHYLSIGFKKITDLIDDFEEELRKTYLIIPKENKVITPEASKILIQRAIHNSFNPKRYKWYLNYKQETKYKFEEQVYDNYTNTMGIFEDDEIFDVSVIRPTFNLHTIDKNTSYVPINFTLPMEEIVAFIEKIKKDSQENVNIIKSPMELLGEELETIEAEDVEKHLPKSFKDKLETMSNALFTYDKFKYLINKHKQLKNKKNKLETEKKIEKETYNRPGRRTKIQNINIKRIEAKYESEIEECKKNIDAIKKAKKAKYKTIYKEIDAAEATVGRYFTFMNKYINNLKYKKLFIKTKDEHTQ